MRSHRPPGSVGARALPAGERHDGVPKALKRGGVELSERPRSRCSPGSSTPVHGCKTPHTPRMMPAFQGKASPAARSGFRWR